MIIEDYNFLMELYKQLQGEISNLDTQVACNLRGIKEAEIFLKDFAEPEDYKIFSPRNKETVYREEIEKILQKKAEYEEQNNMLTQKRNLFSEQADRIEKILSREDRNLTVLRIQEEDRQRIARELHDTSLQNLTHLIHKLELASMYIDTDPIQAKLELSVASKYLKDTIEEIRGTIFDLRPMIFDDLGMKAVLERFLSEMREERDLEIDADIEDVSCETNLVLLSIYRVIQEALNNIVKHANADQILFRFKEVSGRCVIDIEDNGKGFKEEDVDSDRHFGMSLMKERVELLNGEISIDSTEGQGTKIHISIPLGI